jgi:2-methylcitrate dehydratase PrpD
LVAVMLLDGTVSFHAAHDVARMQDPSLLRVRAKVELVPDDELERRAPRREANVTLVLTDGAELNQHVQAVRGTADNPMPREEVVVKCRDLMAPVLGAAKCAGLIDRVLGLESTGDVRDLRPFLQPTG